MARRPAIIKRKPKTVRVTKSEQYLVNRKYMGDEPIYTGNIDKKSLIQYLNWYNCMSTNSEAKQFIIDYLNAIGRNEDAKKIKSINDSLIPTTLAWICRIISKGGIPPKEDIVYAKKLLSSTLESVVVSEEIVSNDNIISIQDRMRERMRDIVGEVEEHIDNYIYNNVEFSLYNWLQSNNIPATYCNNIIDKINPYLEELLEAYKGADSDLKEGYKHLTKTQMKNIIVFFNSLITDAENYSQVRKKVRKARKPKVISVEKKIKNLKYQKEDSNYKIASISPDKIIGAQELWTFNTRYKTISVFRAIDRGGLQIKGTTLIGYDDKNSFTKGTGRKTEEIVRNVLTGGKIVLRKLMDQLNTDKALATRINENTILLRVG